MPDDVLPNGQTVTYFEFERRMRRGEHAELSGLVSYVALTEETVLVGNGTWQTRTREPDAQDSTWLGEFPGRELSVVPVAGGPLNWPSGQGSDQAAGARRLESFSPDGVGGFLLPAAPAARSEPGPGQQAGDSDAGTDHTPTAPVVRRVQALEELIGAGGLQVPAPAGSVSTRPPTLPTEREGQTDFDVGFPRRYESGQAVTPEEHSAPELTPYPRSRASGSADTPMPMAEVVDLTYTGAEPCLR